ncbi:MAG: C4-type zinc ribbon domain-containing protein [Candidatus Omnitrophota bacterium]
MEENTSGSFKTQLEKLIELQALDTELFDIKSLLETFPARIREMDDSLGSKMEGSKNAEQALKNLQVEKNQKEIDMQDKEEKINKHQAQLYQIKNNKEYKALQQEIASIKADVSLIEEEIINLFDAIDGAQKRCDGEKRILEEEKRHVESEKEKLKAEEKALSAKTGEISVKRDEYSRMVEHAIMAEYEKIRENRGRVALARIESECCGGCNMQLRQQVINEAQLKKNIVICGNCSRMLYVEE